MADEKPAGFETKDNYPGYHPAATYTRDEIAQGDKPGVTNSPGNDTWDGNEGSSSDEKSASTARSSSKTSTTSKTSGGESK
ncbi:MAG TPA: hypothetical protein VD864_01075 [Nocardioides sp.]|nr:hypothetical protein [Nocardioides sp.]